jgi:hypothetical protein
MPPSAQEEVGPMQQFAKPMQFEGPREMIPGVAATQPTEKDLLAWSARMSRVNPKFADAATSEIFKRRLDATDPSKDVQIVGDSIYNKRTGKWGDPSPLQQDRLRQQAELKLAEIEQRAEAARIRSEDARATAEQRAAAAALERDAKMERARLMAAVSRYGIDMRTVLAEKKLEAGTPKERAARNEREGQIYQIDQAIEAIEGLTPEQAKRAFGTTQGMATAVGGPVQSWARETVRKLRGMQEFIREMDAKSLTSKPIRTVPGAAAAASGGGGAPPATGGFKIVP